MNTKLALLLTFLSGIATLLGVVPIFINKKYKKVILSFSLSLACSVMLLVSIVSLIPEAYHFLKSLPPFVSIIILLIEINIGIIITKFLQKGINKKSTNTLYNLGIFSSLSLFLHNFPEGMITFITASQNLKLGLTIALSIALHNIPEGISIAVPIYYSTNSKVKAILITLFTGFSEFIAALLTNWFLSQYITPPILSLLLGSTAGIMLTISLSELLPNIIKENKNIFAIIGFLMGAIVILLCNYLI